MRAVGDIAEQVAKTIGEKNVDVERVALDRDRVSEAAETTRHKTTMTAGCVLVVLILGFAAYALNAGPAGAALAGDLVKFGIGALVGGFSGWGLKSAADKK